MEQAMRCGEEKRTSCVPSERQEKEKGYRLASCGRREKKMARWTTTKTERENWEGRSGRSGDSEEEEEKEDGVLPSLRESEEE